MDLVTFFAVSGVLAWALLIWRMVRRFSGVLRRVRWALFGPFGPVRHEVRSLR